MGAIPCGYNSTSTLMYDNVVFLSKKGGREKKRKDSTKGSRLYFFAKT